jgi:phosphate/sulfate permease
MELNIFVVAIIVLTVLAVFDLVVGVSNDAVNFLNSSIGSRVAPRHVIMIIASLGMLAGVTFSSGMMEVARKGIFHPQYFVFQELLIIFLAVMLTDIFLLDLFNTFGLPTSTTVSIVFELLGAAVAVSVMKIHMLGDSMATLINYINTGKALAIISGILLSVAVAFCCGAVAQFFSRLIFTFDYKARLRRYGGIWGGLCLSVITYFILIKGAKGTSFLAPETVLWIKANGFTIMGISFVFFGLIFQLLVLFTKVNILKPIVLVGTFALAMAFAANDLVNFIGVPLAGMEAYKVAHATGDIANATMGALQKKVQSNTLILLCAGMIMVITLWLSRKARTVTETEVNLSRQEEGLERFGSFGLSRSIVGFVTFVFDVINKLTPTTLRRAISKRMDPSLYIPEPSESGQKQQAFDLVRASVNLMVASAVVSYATSMKLPLSTTYVTFMVAMGTSLADQAWGRESAVYRVTGVLTVIGGWFSTALTAFTVAFIFAWLLVKFETVALAGLILLVGFLVWKSFAYHANKKKEESEIVPIKLKEGIDAVHAENVSFRQTGIFLKEISQNLRTCFDAIVTNDRRKIKIERKYTKERQAQANTIIANIFKTLYLLNREDADDHTRKYSRTVGSLQEITESYRDIVLRSYNHTINYHSGLLEAQKEDLKLVRVALNRLLENTAIMLLKRKKIDYDYIDKQCLRLQELVAELNTRQIQRIQSLESKTRLSILFYGYLENSEKIATHTRLLLDIFRDYFRLELEGMEEIKNGFKD